MTGVALLDRVTDEVRRFGFSFVKGEAARSLLSADAEKAWPPFAASWDDLGEDTYMADGGRYRRRRHAVFALDSGVLTRLAHQPHYQSRDYNRLNGGVQRWFEPMEDHAAENPVFVELVDVCARLSTTLEPIGGARRVEAHQFRIAPNAEGEGHPTPEGMHRDGVDWVCVALIKRLNVARGETAIADAAGNTLGAFTLADPLDLVFLDDRRVAHGVTPIRRIDADWPGFRDALVITFARNEP